MLSKRISELKPSPTLALAAKARQLKADGHDVISLTVGEPDWPTYGPAKDAGKKAIDENKTTYTPAAGIPELKKEIATLIGGQLGRDIAPTQVAVASGAKYTLYGAFCALCDPGDEVIVPSPYWVSYPTMVELAGGKPVIVTCTKETDFKMTADQLKAAITDKTKVVLLNSPSNPTGAEYTKEELTALAGVIKTNPKLVVVSDDIYNQLSFNADELSPHLLHVAPELFDRTIAVNGMSKAYSMTGWRMGWAVGPEPVIKAIGSFQSQTTGAPSSISQWASVAALSQCDSQVKQALKDLKERKQFFMDKLASVAGFNVFAPQGAFYLWVNIESWMGKTYRGQTLADSRAVAAQLLSEEKVAVVPGQEFGLDGHLRLSFAASTDNLTKAAERIARFQSELS